MGKTANKICQVESHLQSEKEQRRKQNALNEEAENKSDFHFEHVRDADDNDYWPATLQFSLAITY